MIFLSKQIGYELKNLRINNTSILCGIGPNNWGLGRVLTLLKSEIGRKAIIIHPKKETIGFQNAIKKKSFKALKEEIISRFYKNWQNYLRKNFSNLLKNNLLIIHPQSIGFEYCIDLINKRNKITWLFIVDNSFFCVKSYNFELQSEKNCFDCIENPKSYHKKKCEIWPVKFKLPDYHMKKMEELAKKKKIGFIYQNPNQLKLIIKKFGKNIIYENVGLFTSCIKESFEEFKLLKKKQIKDQILFHGSLNEAKGFSWFLNLARNNPQYKFIVPFDVNINLKNLIKKPMSWENGLKETCIESKLVFCPSLWAAPIESALIKSIIFSENCGVVKVDYSFSDEIDDNIIHKFDIENDKSNNVLLKKIMRNEILTNKKNKAKWLEKYLAENIFFSKNLLKIVKTKT